MLDENALISLNLSMENFQSRFIENFENIQLLADTPKQTIQGFVVNLQCDNYDIIFQQVNFVSI